MAYQRQILYTEGDSQTAPTGPAIMWMESTTDTMHAASFDYPLPVFIAAPADVNLQPGGSVAITGTVDVTGSVISTAGDVAHDAADTGNPLKLGGKASTSTPTAVADGDRVNAFFDEYGRQVVSDRDIELGTTAGITGLRDRIVAQRTTTLSDSLADGIAGFWTQTTAGGGGIASTGGEGRLTTSTGTTGSAQIVSTNVAYFPGQVAWLNSAVRFGDAGTAGNIRRLGMFTVTGTTPQEGFYFELNGTTLNAVTVKAGTPTAVAQASWTRNTQAPFTLDTNYHSLEIRYTANTVWFYIDNVLRHQVSGTSASLTTSLTLPITVTNVKTSGATDITFAIRNIGNGRFGSQGGQVNETGLSAVEALAVGGGTPHDSVDSGNPLKLGGYAKAAAPTAVVDGDRVNAWFSLNGALNTIPAGNVAAAATDSGNPIKIGGKYNSTMPTYTDGQRGDTEITTRGSMKTTLFVDNSATAIAAVVTNADSVAASSIASHLETMSRGSVYNGATWDRLYGNVNGTYVQGNIASGSSDAAGNPVKVGGRYNSTIPTYTDGQRGDLQIGTRGSLHVELFTNNSNTPVGIETTGGDGGGDVQAVDANAFNRLFGGSTWHRRRSNEEATLLASGARTTTQTGSDITNYNGLTSLIVVLDMTTVGTGSVTLTIEGKDTASGKYYTILAGSAVTTNSTNRYRVNPYIASVANSIQQDVLPKVFRITVTANNANSATYSVGYCLIR